MNDEELEGLFSAFDEVSASESLKSSVLAGVLATAGTIGAAVVANAAVATETAAAAGLPAAAAGIAPVAGSSAQAAASGAGHASAAVPRGGAFQALGSLQAVKVAAVAASLTAAVVGGVVVSASMNGEAGQQIFDNVATLNETYQQNADAQATESADHENSVGSKDKKPGENEGERSAQPGENGAETTADFTGAVGSGNVFASEPYDAGSGFIAGQEPRQSAAGASGASDSSGKAKSPGSNKSTGSPPTAGVEKGDVDSPGKPADGEISSQPVALTPPYPGADAVVEPNPGRPSDSANGAADPPALPDSGKSNGSDGSRNPGSLAGPANPDHGNPGNPGNSGNSGESGDPGEPDAPSDSDSSGDSGGSEDLGGSGGSGDPGDSGGFSHPCFPGDLCPSRGVTFDCAPCCGEGNCHCRCWWILSSQSDC